MRQIPEAFLERALKSSCGMIGILAPRASSLLSVIRIAVRGIPLFILWLHMERGAVVVQVRKRWRISDVGSIGVASGRWVADVKHQTAVLCVPWFSSPALISF